MVLLNYFWFALLIKRAEYDPDMRMAAFGLECPSPR